MLTVRSGELVERRLSHSLGRGSGTDSIKLLLSSLILVWWRMISVWVLSRSFNKNVKVTSCHWKGKNKSKSGEMMMTNYNTSEVWIKRGGKSEDNRPHCCKKNKKHYTSKVRETISAFFKNTLWPIVVMEEDIFLTNQKLDSTVCILLSSS